MMVCLKIVRDDSSTMINIRIESCRLIEDLFVAISVPRGLRRNLSRFFSYLCKVEHAENVTKEIDCNESFYDLVSGDPREPHCKFKCVVLAGSLFTRFLLST